MGRQKHIAVLNPIAMSDGVATDQTLPNRESKHPKKRCERPLGNESAILVNSQCGTRWLKDREVVVISDNDEVGRNHVQLVAQSLHGGAKSVRVLILPDLPDGGGGVSDWLDAGGTPEGLVDLDSEADEWSPEQPALIQMEHCPQSTTAVGTCGISPHIRSKR